MREDSSASGRSVSSDDAVDMQQEREAERWRMIYGEARRAHEFRVAEVAAQQGRLATVLAANGIVFGFLGSAAPVFVAKDTPLAAGALFVAALGLLAAGLVAGAVGQWPKIAVRGAGHEDARGTESGSFLDPGNVLTMGESRGTASFYEWLARSVRDDAAKARHVAVLRFRRRVIRTELVCLSAGAVLAVAAVLVHLVAQ